MSTIRTLSTRRLLALVAIVVVALGAGAAIAGAALDGSGPTPPAKPLAQAISDGLRAPAPEGVSARVSFTNRLIDSSNLEGSDPVLSGASGRLWWSRDGRFRLELQASSGEDAQVLVDRRSWWAYDGAANTVYRGTLPAKRADATRDHAARKHAMPTLAEIQRELAGARKHLDIGGAVPATVAGRAAYDVRVGPRRDGGLLGAARLAWDAATGTPLRIGVYARGDSRPVLQLEATDITYGALPSGAFDAAPPKGAKVVTVSAPTGAGARAGRAHHVGRAGRTAAKVSGVDAVQAKLPFQLSAPATLAGLPRQEVRLLRSGRDQGALVTYGRGLGGIAVMQTAAHKARPATPHGRQQLRLPDVSINGATGQELATALGTVVTFTRGGVSYTVLGSVPAVAAETAARGL